MKNKKLHILTILIGNRLKEAFDIDEILPLIDNGNKLRNEVIIDGINFGTKEVLEKLLNDIEEELSPEINNLIYAIQEKLYEKKLGKY